MKGALEREVPLVPRLLAWVALHIVEANIGGKEHKWKSKLVAYEKTS